MTPEPRVNARHIPVAIAWLSLALTVLPSAASSQAIPVELRESPQGWQLLRGGEPYVIQGAGGTGSLQQLAAAGANSVRTWAADDIGGLLDEAHALDLSVTVGIWLGQMKWPSWSRSSTHCPDDDSDGQDRR